MGSASNRDCTDDPETGMICGGHSGVVSRRSHKQADEGLEQPGSLTTIGSGYASSKRMRKASPEQIRGSIARQRYKDHRQRASASTADTQGIGSTRSEGLESSELNRVAVVGRQRFKQMRESRESHQGNIDVAKPSGEVWSDNDDDDDDTDPVQPGAVAVQRDDLNDEENASSIASHPPENPYIDYVATATVVTTDGSDRRLLHQREQQQQSQQRQEQSVGGGNDERNKPFVTAVPLRRNRYYLLLLLVVIIAAVAVVLALLAVPRGSSSNQINSNEDTLQATPSPSVAISSPASLPPSDAPSDTPSFLPTTAAPSLSPSELPSTLPSLSPLVWDSVATLTGQVRNEGLGVALATNFDGTVLAMGAPFFNERLGYVRVMELNPDGTASRQLGPNLMGFGTGSSFGISVGLNRNGTILATGARLGGPNSTGYVRVSVWNGTDWTAMGSDLLGPEEDSYFGSAVALSADGTTLVVGAPHYRGSVGFRAGTAMVFRFNGTDWVQLGQTFVGTDRQFELGDSVAISDNGNTVALAMPGYNVLHFGAGAAAVYTLTNGTNWTLLGQPVTVQSGNSYLGTSLAMSGDGRIIAAGAHRYSDVAWGAGLVRAYRFQGNTTEWVQLGQDLNGENEDDQFGVSLDLSANGETLVVGADRAGSTYSGQAQVFRLQQDSMSWLLAGESPLEIMNQQKFGAQVVIAGDASKVTVSDPYNEGEVQVFRPSR